MRGPTIPRDWRAASTSPPTPTRNSQPFTSITWIISPLTCSSKFFDVLLDPGFKREEITFESVWDIFDYVSMHRKPGPLVQMIDESEPSSPTTPERTVVSSYVVPLDVVSMVVDRMVEDREPLGVTAQSPGWRRVYNDNMANFRQMSLVHRSWTPIVRRGLRRRAVVPYHSINRFLLSPLCGPWITEMIIYWTVDNGYIGITESAIVLLEALLHRVPKLRSLSFNTSLIWPRGGSHLDDPSLKQDICLELMSELLPNLENLWLKHFEIRNGRTESDPPYCFPSEESLSACCGLDTLCLQVPRLRSLKFLSIRSWKSRLQTDLNEHPPSGLEEIQLDFRQGIPEEHFAWLVKPRGAFKLRTLSLAIRWANDRYHNFEIALRECLPKLEKLQLFLLHPPDRRTPDNAESFCRSILERCDQLVSLDMFFVSGKFDLRRIVFPSSLERLALHYHDQGQALLHGLSRLTEDMRNHLPRLPHLRCLVVTGWLYKGWDAELDDMDVIIHHMDRATTVADDIPEQLLALCNEHNIELVCRSCILPG